MKSSTIPLLLLITAFALPIFLWASLTQQADIRSRADEPAATPTATPSATPTSTATPTLTPTPTNTPPRCSGISVNPGAGAKPLTVQFSCAGFDPDNDITAAEFGFGAGEKRLVEKGTGQFGAITTSFTYTEAGTYNVTCRVRDNNQVFSSYPDYCKYTVVVSENTLTPTPRRTPTPTIPIVDLPATNSSPIIFGGGLPSVTPMPTLVPIPPTPTPVVRSFWTNEKVAQLVLMLIVSGVVIIVALLLHGFFDKQR